MLKLIKKKITHIPVCFALYEWSRSKITPLYSDCMNKIAYTQITLLSDHAYKITLNILLYIIFFLVNWPFN